MRDEEEQRLERRGRGGQGKEEMVRWVVSTVAGRWPGRLLAPVTPSPSLSSLDIFLTTPLLLLLSL